MKFTKLIGLFVLICFAFIYTDKVIDVTINQDSIMTRIKEEASNTNINPQNAIIDNNTIIPGTVGTYIDELASYKAMKKIGYYEPSLLIYKNIYPEVSIYNNYNKYIINGNIKLKNISLIYILNSNNTLDKILNITKKYNIIINFFIDSTYLNNNINIINDIIPNHIYNYGNNGIYTKDNLIITNNIINNKSNNPASFCLFLKEDTNSLTNCANSKMLSIIPKDTINYYNIKSNLENGNIILINNTQELPNIIEYILSKGYNIVSLPELIKEV